MANGDFVGYTSLVLFEFFRSFTYYGIQVALFFLFYTELRWPMLDSVAMVHFHGLLFYLCAMIGVFVAHKRKTLFVNFFCLIAIIGNCFIFACVYVHGVAKDWDHVQMFMEGSLILGMFLRAAGSGLIREIPMRIGEDMAAKLEDPRKTRSRFYLLLFYAFSGSIGLAVLLLPALRMNVAWAGMNMAWPLPIGIAVISLIIGIICFNCGAIVYRKSEPLPNEIKKISQCIFSGDAYREAEYRYNDYDDDFAEDAGQAGRVAILFIPLPLFWALFEQVWTRWPYQGLRMNGLVNSTVPLEPDSMFIAVPLVNMFVLPFFEYLIFPLLLHVVFCSTPKCRIVFGAFLALLAFGMACTVETFIQEEMEQANMTIPPDTAELILLNPTMCDLTLTAAGLPSAYSEISLMAHGLIFIRDIPCSDKIPFRLRNFKSTGQNIFCNYMNYTYDRTYYVYKNSITGLFSGSDTDRRLQHVPPLLNMRYPYVEEVFFRPPVKGGLQVPQMGYAYKVNVNRTAAAPACHQMGLYNPLRFSNRTRHLPTYKHSMPYELFPSGKYYPDYCGMTVIGTDYFALKKGGVYMMVPIQKEGGVVFGSVQEVEKPFKHALTWQLPQYVVMALAQLLCPALVLDYTYRQVNRDMVPWLLFMWLFMAALGNLIVFVEAISGVFQNQVHAYYFYLVLMLVGIIILIVCCCLYEHLEPEEEEEAEEEQPPAQR